MSKEMREHARSAVRDWLGGCAPEWMLVCGSGMGAGLMEGVDDGGLGLTVERQISLLVIAGWDQFLWQSAVLNQSLFD